MANELASLASEARVQATGKGFKSRISFLDRVVAAWAANEEVSLKGEINFVNVAYSKGTRTSDESE